MVYDMIQEIKQVELSASAIEKDAKAEAEMIIKTASVESEKRIAEAVEHIKEENENRLKIVEMEGEQFAQKRKEEAEKEIHRLQIKAGEKEQEAIQLVLAEIM